MAKTALVVDDSRVAAVGLARLLKERGLQVDTAESGPEALDFLRLNPPPSAIFLDHMMPGMDGFETLKVLKSSPNTSAIPVVMFTSKEDVDYAREAQARGAFGVLRKPPQSLEIEQLLAALRVAREARTETVTVSTPESRPAQPVSAPAPVMSAPVEHPAPAPVREASAEPESPTRSPSALWPLALLVVLVGAVVWGYAEYRVLARKMESAVAENAALKTEKARLSAEWERLKTEQEERVKNENANVVRLTADSYRRLLDTIGWGMSEQGRYDFGEVPFSDARLRQVRELVTRLSEANFRGTIRLDSHLGDFCLVRDGQGRLRLPPPGTSFSACERVSYPVGEAVRLAQRQSDGFARFLIENASARNSIEIVIFSHGVSRPAQRYPDPPPYSSAEWNYVARRNQRVEISLVPAIP